MATSTQNCDREYMLRLLSLILDGGSYVYRKVLEDRACKMNNDLQTHLNKSKTKIGKHVPKHLSPGQFNKLFPNNGPAIATTAEDFDITLLAFLIQNTCTYKNEVWTKAQPGDFSTIADLARVREFRNNILHSPTTERFDKAEFVKQWIDIETVLLRLSPNDQSLVDIIKAWQTEPFDKDLESECQKLKQQLEQWEKWEGVQEKVKILETTVEKINKTLMIGDIDDQAFGIKSDALRDIARHVIGKNWQPLKTDLNVPSIEFSRIESAAIKEEEKIFQMLCSWQRSADKTTVEDLFKTLKYNAMSVTYDVQKLKKIKIKYQLV